MVNFDLGQVGEVFRRKDKGAIVSGDNPEEEEDVDASEFEEDEVKPVRTKNRRPKEDTFTQQRLAAINPVLTPRTVLPLYLLIAVVFVIVGGCILAQNSKVDEVTIYYQDCMTNATSSWSDIPSEHWQFVFHKYKTYNTAPQWRFVDDESDDFTKQRGTCQIRFTTPSDMKNNVYLNYVLEKFAANHRRYVLSFSEDQIRGEDASYETVHDATGINCKPLSKNADGKIYYPCGLIANSMFNDTFPLQLTNVGDTSNNYSLTNKGINWESDKKRYKKPNTIIHR
ncbi:YNL323Wp-like protein [Saccharomyces cerevisiae AWRI1631]|uniref:YNL323Wp-like protein n=1 Tax=Saccharomyces cerevisiae (strain AWRI1631) TaxID=545124 RepID=B5VQ97_YEAS6|nr:YNL323Wp-like protein [Saccharomyces cerevisiae AWRI1631]